MENPFDLIMDKLNNIEQQLKELRELHKQEFKDERMDIIELGKYINYQKTSIYGLVQNRKIPFIKPAALELAQILSTSTEIKIAKLKQNDCLPDYSRSCCDGYSF